MARRIRRVVVSFPSFLFALFCAAVVGLIAATVSAYALVYCVGLPLVLICELLGGSIGGATTTVGGISVIILSLLTGLTLGTEVYIGVAQPELPWNGPTPGWLRALWATAAGALVGALPCAVGVDWLLLGPAQAVPHALDAAAAPAMAVHLVSLGGLMGATTGLAMERFWIWRHPSRDSTLLVVLFLLWIGLLWSFIPTREADLRLSGVLVSLAYMQVVSLLILLMNLWAIHRGEFRWYREGIASATILVICGAIIFPVYSSALTEAAHARMTRARRAQRLPL